MHLYEVRTALSIEVASRNLVQRHGYLIADLATSRSPLAANQSIPGYRVLICKKLVRKLYHLSVLFAALAIGVPIPRTEMIPANSTRRDVCSSTVP